MGVKYIPEGGDFKFSSDFGFTGSAGKHPVRGYMRGGMVKHGKGGNNAVKANEGRRASGSAFTEQIATVEHVESGAAGTELRPGYMKGGHMKKGRSKKKHYAEGGRKRSEEIEFTGKELDEIMEGASHPKKMKPDRRRGTAAADAFIKQLEKGKSREAADDAADVMRGFGDYDRPTRKYRWKEKAKGGAISTVAKMEGGKVAKVMGEYKRGKLHSGSKKGPIVKSRKQAQAIAMSEAGMSRKRKS